VPTQRIPYLFGERATVQDVVETQRQAVAKAINELDANEILQQPFDDLVAALVHKFRLDMPTLHRERTVQLETVEVDIDVSHDPMRAIIPGRGPYIVKGSNFRIAIPFTGEAVLFKYGTSPYPYINPIVGEVEDDQVILRFQTDRPDAARIKADFDGRAAQIEEVLTMARGRTEEWNRELANIVPQKLKTRRENLEQAGTISLGFPAAPPKPLPAPPAAPRRDRQKKTHDVFLSHASEDKDAIARPLYEALTAEGVSVWYDEAALTLGDSLRQKIDEGLARCSYGIVILSPVFFSKQWPKMELDGLVAKETSSGKKAILPIWHEIDQKGVTKYSPLLAGRLAGRSEDGMAKLLQQILAALRA